MPEQPTSPSSTQLDLLSFEFQRAIPSAHTAGLLKFGLEALPGVERVGFIADRAIRVAINAGAVEMERVWQVIANAGFATDEVTQHGGLLVVAPVEFEEDTAATLPMETAAA